MAELWQMLQVKLKKFVDFKTGLLVLMICTLIGSSLNNWHARPEQSKLQTQHPRLKKPPALKKTSKMIYVDIKGAVVKPDVYAFKGAVLVNHAIAQAGGLAQNADVKAINLAQKLFDGQMLYVPRSGEKLEGDAMSAQMGPQKDGLAQTGAAQKFDLNTATEQDLQTIPGIGPKKASDIVSYRETNGAFQGLDDLKKIGGFGDKTIEKLSSYFNQ